MLVDKSGQALSEIAYYPYGLTRYDSNAVGLSYRFTGKELDESELYYFEARYYDPMVGRFLSVDPLYVENLNEEKLQDVQNLNIYVYASNSPVQRIDVDGLEDIPIVDSVSNDRTAHAPAGSKVGLVIDTTRPTIGDLAKQGQELLNTMAEPVDKLADIADNTADVLADNPMIPQMGPINEMGMRYTAEQIRGVAGDIRNPAMYTAKETAQRYLPILGQVDKGISVGRAIMRGFLHRIHPQVSSPKEPAR